MSADGDTRGSTSGNDDDNQLPPEVLQRIHDFIQLCVVPWAPVEERGPIMRAINFDGCGQALAVLERTPSGPVFVVTFDYDNGERCRLHIDGIKLGIVIDADGDCAYEPSAA